MIRKLLAISILSSFIWTSSLAPLCAAGMEDVIPRGADEVTPPIQVNAGDLGMDIKIQTPTDLPDTSSPFESPSPLPSPLQGEGEITANSIGKTVSQPEVSPSMFQSAMGMFNGKAGAVKPVEKAAEEVGAQSSDGSMDKKLSELYDGNGQGGYWDSRPDRIEPLKDIDQLNLKDPLIAKAIEEAGSFYEEARKNPPKGRLGGRKELFTQRDLMRAWVLSFERDYTSLKAVSDPKLALFIAFYRAVEFSYGAGLDYDPADAQSGDRKVYKPILLDSLRNLAQSLDLPEDSSTNEMPGEFVDKLSRKIANVPLEDLLAKAGAVPSLSKSGSAKTFENALGESGGILRSSEDMRRHLVTEVDMGGKTEKIASLWRLLTHLKHAILLNLPVVLVGPTGTAKSTVVKWLAAAAGVRQLSVAMRPSVGKEEMIGAIRPMSKGLAWQWGFLIKAVLNGDWVTMEEFNLSPSEVLEFLNEFLNSGFARLTQHLDEETLAAVLPAPLYEDLKSKGFILTPHPKFRIFMTMNPDFYSSRNKLAQTLMNRLLQIWVPDYSPSETEKILSARYGLSSPRAMGLVDNFYKGLKTKIASGQLGREQKDKYEINFRTLLRISQDYVDNLALYAETHNNKKPDQKTDLLLWGRSLWDVVGVMMRSDLDRDELWLLMDLSFGFKNESIDRKDLEPDVRSIRFDAQTRKVIFDDPLLPLSFDLKPGGSFVPPERFNLPPTPQILNQLYWLSRRLVKGEHVLLVGETAAGKTSFVQFAHRLLNASLRYTNLSSESADEEVGGGYQPDPGNPGKFRFSPGLLERAGKDYGGKGASLFIDEFNLSSLVEWFNTAQDDRILVTPEGPVTLGPETVLIGAMNPPKYQGRNMLSPAIRGRYWEAWIGEPDQNEASLRLGWMLKKIMEDGSSAPAK